ncbi:MAG: response regulator transcription factor [Planctomycetaceae bacterium]
MRRELGFKQRAARPNRQELAAVGDKGMIVDQKLKRVLVVDDDDQFLEATRAVLEQHGYEVLVAHDGHEGLVQAERTSPDLIVLDVMMPRRSGFGVLDHIGQRRSGPRIVMVTANDDQRHAEIAHAKGAHGFLRKPFEVHELLETIESLLEVESSECANKQRP